MAEQDRDAKGVSRRSALRAVGVGAAAAATAPLAAGDAAAQAAGGKTKARFKADAEQVKTYYRVNKY